MSGLPNAMLPQTARLGTVDDKGNVTIDVNWYLLLYNIANQVLNQANGAIAGNPADLFLTDSISAADISNGQSFNVAPDPADVAALAADIAKIIPVPQTVDFADVSLGMADMSQLRAMYQTLQALIANITEPVDLPVALSVTITTAKLTALGSNGMMTFTNGRLTAQTSAT
jgi:hypothetical protein